MEFSLLLREHMERSGFSSRGLARQANKLGEGVSGWSPLHPDGDGIENWIRRRRIRRRIRPRYWMQLAAVSQTLELDEAMAQELFTVAGHSLDGLRVIAEPSQRRLLEFGQDSLLARGNDRVAAGNELVVSKRAVTPFRSVETSLVPMAHLRRSRRWAATTAAGFVASICLAGAAIADVGPFGESDSSDARTNIADGPVTETVSEADQASPMLPATPVGRACVIDLAEQPFGPSFIAGQSSVECPEMMVWNQYEGYEADDLLPWEQGVAQCFAGSALVRLWVGFDLSDGTQGWLPLTPGLSGADIFKENRPVEPELRASATTTAPTIGTFEYSELAGNAFAVQLDLPEQFDTSTARPERGDYALGGCWQEKDRDGSRGLSFYWPPGVNP